MQHARFLIRKSLFALPFLLLYSVGQQSFGQAMSADDDYLIWETSKLRNTITNKMTEQAGVFKSGSDSIVWSFDNGKMSASLPVISKQDTWLNVNEDGSTLYNLIWKDIPGTVLFRRTNGETTIVMEFIKDKVNLTPYEFTVSQIVKN